MSDTHSAIELKDLCKEFRLRKGPLRHRRIRVLRSVSLSVPTGSVLGLLGPNGAGKTTLLRILTTVLLPTSGEARLAGISVSQVERVKRLIGVVPASARGFTGQFNACQNLEFYAVLQGLSSKEGRGRIDTLLPSVGLESVQENPFWTYSSGQRKRLSIARALLQNPPILLFDEPCQGLDPWTAFVFRNWIRQDLVLKKGKTLLFTTNQPEDIPGLCDAVGVMRNGRLVSLEKAETFRLE